MLSTALANDLCLIAFWVGDLETAERRVDRLLDASGKHGLVVRNATGRCLKGMLLLAKNDRAGLAMFQAALRRLRELSLGFHYPLYLAMSAQQLADAGQTAEAGLAIDEALERADTNEERRCMPELLRIKGEVLRMDGAADSDRAAEDYFLRALEDARRQEALSWELRVATSLAKLWRQNNKIVEAHELLSGVYDRFTEGFDTADLKAAKALIGELRVKPPAL